MHPFLEDAGNTEPASIAKLDVESWKLGESQ
jgi:hypothetical protein